MAVPASSARRHSASPTCANFVAAYAPMKGTPRLPTIDDTMMRWPWPWRLNTGTRGACGVESAEVVDVNEPAHLRRRHLVDRAGDAEPGVAHHHVEPPELLDCATDQIVHVLFARDVGHQRNGVATDGFNLGGKARELASSACRQDEGCAVAAEPERGRASDTGRCSGNGHHARGRGPGRRPLASHVHRAHRAGRTRCSRAARPDAA